jgi:hypothetical protein
MDVPSKSSLFSFSDLNAPRGGVGKFWWDIWLKLMAPFK